MLMPSMAIRTEAYLPWISNPTVSSDPTLNEQTQGPAATLTAQSLTGKGLSSLAQSSLSSEPSSTTSRQYEIHDLGIFNRGEIAIFRL